MSIEDNAKQNFFEEKTAEKRLMEEFAEAEAGGMVGQEAGTANDTISIDFGWLMKKTGIGTIETYLDHPMNPKGSRGMARVLRGCTGIAGDLDLAIIDIVLGGFELIMERKHGGGVSGQAD